MKATEAAVAVTAAVAPSIGPAIVTAFGTPVPVLSLVLSVAGLLLARIIAPPPLRKLTRRQQISLTALLVIILFLLVTGGFTGTPMQPGLAVIWGVGLGFSGIVVVELFAERAMAMLRVMFGMAPKDQ